MRFLNDLDGWMTLNNSVRLEHTWDNIKVKKKCKSWAETKKIVDCKDVKINKHREKDSHSPSTK